MYFASRTETTRDDWQTPNYIVESLGEFDLDPCANMNNPTRLARTGWFENGFDQDWFGRVWLNPPYGDICKDWISRLARHNNGIALIPPRVGSKWFHKLVFKTTTGILFLEGRISFLGNDLQPVVGNNTDSILIAFGDYNVEFLKNSGLAGELWDRR